MPEISKITLPSGTTYDLKDATARSAIANINNWSYVVCTSAANTPKDVTWDNSGTTVTGTLVAASTTMYKIYLVPSTNGTNDIYDEYITVNPSGTTYKWEMFGNTDVHIDDLGSLAYKNSASGSYTPAGSNASSSVSFSGGTTATVLTGVKVTAQPSVALTENSSSQTGAVTYVKSIGTSGTNSVTFNTTNNTADAVTGYSSPTSDTFVKSYPGETKKIKQVTGKYVATSASGGGSVTAGTACTMPTYTVSDEVLTITAGTANTPTAVTLPSFSSQTLSDGTLTTSGSGGTVMTGLGTATTASAMTGLGDPSTATVLKSTVSATVPKTSATTKYLTASASGATVGSDGTETVIKTIGTATAAAQTFTGTAATITVS